MKPYIAIDKVPELADLTEVQRRTVLHYYRTRELMLPGLRLAELGFVGLIILAEIAGFIGGFVYWRTPFWGPLVGAMIALVLVMVFGFVINTYLMIPRLRRFLRSDDAQGFIKVLKESAKANAPFVGPTPKP
jgi:hypothetical protein